MDELSFSNLRSHNHTPPIENYNYIKFIIETEQHYNLLRSFRPKQAFYIFVALNNVSEIISNRNDFLKYCIALDIHKIPTDITLNHRTRVVRMVKSSLAPRMEIDGKRKLLMSLPQVHQDLLCFI